MVLLESEPCLLRFSAPSGGIEGADMSNSHGIISDDDMIVLKAKQVCCC